MMGSLFLESFDREEKHSFWINAMQQFTADFIPCVIVNPGSFEINNFDHFFRSLSL